MGLSLLKVNGHSLIMEWHIIGILAFVVIYNLYRNIISLEQPEHWTLRLKNADCMKVSGNFENNFVILCQNCRK